jgi:ASC-1-like (ASCH) protein
MPKEHTMKLSSPWYELVCEEKKTVEIRLNDAKRQKVRVGDTIVFTHGKRSFRRRVEKISRHVDFEHAIRASRLEKALPGVNTVADGVNIYHAIPGYKNGAEDYGVVAFYLTPIPFVFTHLV